MRFLWPILFMALAGCGFSHYPPAQTHLSASDAVYRLSANDEVFIRVFEESELTGAFKIDSQGMVALPLAGKISVQGQTEKEAATTITQSLQKGGFLRNPKVAVEIKNARPVFIMGEVGKPGEYPYQPGMTIYKAAAIAGGYTYRADRDDIGITRQGAQLSATEKTPLLPGDVIEIGERYF